MTTKNITEHFQISYPEGIFLDHALTLFEFCIISPMPQKYHHHSPLLQPYHLSSISSNALSIMFCHFALPWQTTQSRRLKKQALISHSLKGGTYKVKVPANIFPDESSHPDMQIATFSLHPHREERESSAFSSTSYGPYPITGAPCSHDLI